MVPNRRWTLMREVPFTEGTSLMSAYFSRMEGKRPVSGAVMSLRSKPMSSSDGTSMSDLEAKASSPFSEGAWAMLSSVRLRCHRLLNGVNTV